MTQPNLQPGQTGLRVRSSARAGEWRQESDVSWFSPLFEQYLTCNQSKNAYTARWICQDEIKHGAPWYIDGMQEIEDYLRNK
jgi:hypothetical protein